jgi:hypothetical protein
MSLHVMHAEQRNSPRKRQSFCEFQAYSEVTAHSGAAGH